MPMLWLASTLTLLLLLGLPLLLRRVVQYVPLINDVVLCFLVGGLLGYAQQAWWPEESFQTNDETLAQGVLSASVLLAIPLLLLSSDVGQLKQYSKRYLFSFVLCVGSTVVAACCTAFYFKDLPHLATTTGGLVGVYTGGTPNLVAVLYALRAPEELFVTLNATDVFCSSIYFLVLISVAQTALGWILPRSKQTAETDAVEETETTTPTVWNKAAWQELSQALMVTIGCLAVSVLLAWLVFPTEKGKINELVLILTLSSTGIGLSFWPKLSFGSAVYDFAQYLLLIFAFVLGYLVDFSVLLETGTTYLAFNIILLGLLLILHLMLARLFGIDVDLFLIPSTACVMGPPFVGPVCRALNNKSLLVPGVALSLLGLIVGTYLGIGIALYLPI